MSYNHDDDTEDGTDSSPRPSHGDDLALSPRQDYEYWSSDDSDESADDSTQSANWKVATQQYQSAHATPPEAAGGGDGAAESTGAVLNALAAHHATIGELLRSYNTRERAQLTVGAPHACQYNRVTGIYTLPLYGISNTTYGPLLSHLSATYGANSVDICTQTSAKFKDRTLLLVDIQKRTRASGGAGAPAVVVERGALRTRTRPLCCAVLLVALLCAIAAIADKLSPQPPGSVPDIWRIAARTSVATASGAASLMRGACLVAVDALVAAVPRHSDAAPSGNNGADGPPTPETVLDPTASEDNFDATTRPPPSLVSSPPPTAVGDHGALASAAHGPSRRAQAVLSSSVPDERDSLGYRVFSAIVSSVFGDSLEQRSHANNGVYLNYGSDNDDDGGGGSSSTPAQPHSGASVAGGNNGGPAVVQLRNVHTHHHHHHHIG